MTLTHLANTVGPVYLYLAVLGIGFAFGWFAVQIKRHWCNVVWPEIRFNWKYRRLKRSEGLRHARPWWE